MRRVAHRQCGREASKSIVTHFQNARRQGLVVNSGDIVSGYWPMRDELDIRQLLSDLHGEGLQCALPVIKTSARPLLFRRWQPGMAMEQASYGLSEPPASSSVLTPQILLVPLLAVDPYGNRVGYGGGYYDRTLKYLRQTVPIVAVGIAFEVQRVANVPYDEQDAPLDWVVTEKAFYRCAKD